MALVQCHECGKSVSTESKKCLGCGATVKIPKSPRKPISKLVLGILGVMGIATVVMVTANESDIAATNKAAAEKLAVANKVEDQRIAAMTPEQRTQMKIQRDKQESANKAKKDKQDAEEKAAKDKESQTRGLALASAKALKNSSKDPQTFEFTSVVTHPNSSVCFEYRAKNSFNAMLAGSAVLANGKLLVREHAGNAFVQAWNKNCTVSDGEEVVRLVLRVLESS